MSRTEMESSVKAFKDFEKSEILKLIGNTPLLKVELFKDVLHVLAGQGATRL